ncbi:SDR family oxidoreductase [Chryseobacterium daecheongense]|uniref:Aldehyde reductase n=1 Tax=Chryseobacterium daecheongense TaxID=192389 RepID=A0A3N0W479_9FLAO|nr:aldehyde reductase [Chryseobacterium daecheongense]ROH99875.1 aldehyde reductase [Chryseobacterium daecheongense]TDX95194.1 nucleoside-diphosphate-sugar epimerase [Chryseobacterium daecheongense]
MNTKETVLVTGGSGFIASYCIIALLNNGYKVKATLRSLKKSELVKSMLKEGGIHSFQDLSFVEADLQDEFSWEKAVEDCQYVIHVASPTPYTNAQTEDDFVIPAKNGVLFVMRAAKKAGVKRVVLTSAFGAVAFGTVKTTPYTEEDWTVLNETVFPYQKSKTISEKAAWDFIQNEGKGMELAVVNPTGVLGPVLADDFSHSIQNVKQMLNGEMKACPKITSGYVDVRDVADLHFKAMTIPEANGHRFIAVAGEGVSLLDISNVLRKNLGEKAAKVPTKELPSWIIKLLAIFNPKLKVVTPYLGMVKRASSEKAIRMLGWKPRSTEESILATANSLIQLNIVK